MRAIKKITYIQNNTLIIQGLDSMNYKEVEVIIMPITDKRPGLNTGNKFSTNREY
jgi:hypothetical protein